MIQMVLKMSKLRFILLVEFIILLALVIKDLSLEHSGALFIMLNAFVFSIIFQYVFKMTIYAPPTGAALVYGKDDIFRKVAFYIAVSAVFFILLFV